MKKILLGVAILVSTASFAVNPPVDEQVSKQFKETFPAAANVKWYEYETFYEVLFETNGMICRVKYDLKGNILSTRRDYHQEQLPPFIVAKVKERYKDKNIFGITEITSPEGLSYIIILQDSKHWITINSNDSGELSFVRKLKKA